MFKEYEQLELLIDELYGGETKNEAEEIDDDDDEDITLTKKRPQPTPDTGYLCCSKCNLINPYEFPQEDWVCPGCLIFDDWAKK
jgi:hypothetical protein